MRRMHQKKVVSHFVGLSGIGGVQSNFSEYMSHISLYPSRYCHRVYTIGSVDSQYKIVNNVLDIRKISNLFRLVLDIISNRVIVHFYNNLSSFKVAFFLALMPVSKLVIHERGTSWNKKHSSWMIPRFISWKARVVLSNSIATKTMLVKKFCIPDKKIHVLHNGIDISRNTKCNTNQIKNNTIFYKFSKKLEL